MTILATTLISVPSTNRSSSEVGGRPDVVWAAWPPVRAAAADGIRLFTMAYAGLDVPIPGMTVG